MNIKYILIASTVSFLAVSSAHAADVIHAEEPVPVFTAPAFSWTGAYIGGQVGYGWGKSQFAFDGGSEKFKPNGFLGGLYAGYNFGVGSNAILGIDADITYNDLSEGGASIDEASGFTESLESKLRWSGAVRARLGYAVDRVMPYIAGGVAFGNIKNTYTQAFPDTGIQSSLSETRTGWTAGAGVDYAVTDNVIMRLEYRYTDYGRKTFDTDIGDVSFRNKFKTNEVRLGVAYKF